MPFDREVVDIYSDMKRLRLLVCINMLHENHVKFSNPQYVSQQLQDGLLHAQSVPVLELPPGSEITTAKNGRRHYMQILVHFSFNTTIFCRIQWAKAET